LKLLESARNAVAESGSDDAHAAFRDRARFACRAMRGPGQPPAVVLLDWDFFCA